MFWNLHKKWLQIYKKKIMFISEQFQFSNPNYGFRDRWAWTPFDIPLLMFRSRCEIRIRFLSVFLKKLFHLPYQCLLGCGKFWASSYFLMCICSKSIRRRYKFSGIWPNFFWWLLYPPPHHIFCEKNNLTF